MNVSMPFRRADVANGEGVRVTLFVSGCRIHCPHCFNKEAQSFDYGVPYTKEIQDDIIKALEPDWVQGLTILGGEPFEPENQRGIFPLLVAVREKYGFKKDIWVYTGYVLEKDLAPGGSKYIRDLTDVIKTYIDVLVDGPFIEELKDPTLEFRGSSNQRIIRFR